MSATAREDEERAARMAEHNESVLPGLMADSFARLSPAQRKAVLRISDLFVSSAAWRRVKAGHDQAVPLDLDAMPREGA